MRILAVTSTPPWPATHGAAIRNGLLLEALAREHQVDLVTLDRPGAPATPAPPCMGEVIQVRAAPPSNWRRLRGGWRGGVPDLLIRHGSRVLRGRVQLLLSSGAYDAVHVAQAQLAPLIRDVRTASTGTSRRPRAVYDAHNIEWKLQAALADVSAWPRSLWARRQAGLLRRVEAWIARTADLVVASSTADRVDLAALGAASPVYIPHPVPIGAVRPSTGDRAVNPRVLFAANFAYRPNILAAEWLFGRVWPAIARELPEAELRVVGPQSERLQPIVPVRTTLGGTVDDIEREYQLAWIAVSPTSVAGGAPYKVLSALAAGRPVVARAQGYVGLPAGDGTGVMVPERPDEFAAAVTGLAQDPESYQRTTSAGFAFVKTEHDAAMVGRQLLDAYARLEAPAIADGAA